MKFNDREDCPFCNNSWGSPQAEKSAEGGRWNVSCMNARCGASSGFCDSEAEALELWNKRPEIAVVTPDSELIISETLSYISEQMTRARICVA